MALSPTSTGPVAMSRASASCRWNLRRSSWLLRELRPGAASIAVLVDPKFPTTERFVSEARAAASAAGQQLIVLEVSSDREIETAFTTLVQRGAGALFWGTGSSILSQR